MNAELDRISVKVLKKLYRSDLTGAELDGIVGWNNRSQPNEIESFLRAEQLVTVCTDGMPDGEGGYVPETVKRRYSITRRGRAVVEQLKRNRGNTLLRILELFPLR